MKHFETHTSLIKKLEVRAGISFSSTTKKLYDDKGYIRIKNTILFMRQNKIKINNRTIMSIYKADKHLRHTLMPRIETFEMKLKNHMLHTITEVATDGLIFDSRTTKRIYVKSKRIKSFKEHINKNLTRSFHEKYNVDSDKRLIFEWIHKLTLGDIITLFNFLQDTYKKKIFKSAFEININVKTINQELTKIRKLRNKIAHAEQLFDPKKTSCITNQLSVHNYVLAIKQNINKSQLKKPLKSGLKFIDDYLKILKKHSM